MALPWREPTPGRRPRPQPHGRSTIGLDSARNWRQHHDIGPRSDNTKRVKWRLSDVESMHQKPQWMLNIRIWLKGGFGFWAVIHLIYWERRTLECAEKRPRQQASILLRSRKPLQLFRPV